MLTRLEIDKFPVLRRVRVGAGVSASDWKVDDLFPSARSGQSFLRLDAPKRPSSEPVRCVTAHRNSRGAEGGTVSCCGNELCESVVRSNGKGTAKTTAAFGRGTESLNR